MLIEERPTHFLKCPRCHDQSYEVLRTHSYCVNCNYHDAGPSDEPLVIPQWVIEALKVASTKSTLRELNPKKENEKPLDPAV